MSGPPPAAGGGTTAEQEQLIERFCAITGSRAERARFFLESTRWNLELAMESFFENNEAAEIAAHLPQQPKAATKTSPNRLGPLNPTNDSSDTDEDVKVVDEKQPAKMPKFLNKKRSPMPKKVAARATPGERRIATLNDIKSQQSRDGDNSESDSGNESSLGPGSSRKDDRQAFYVGGSDKSGQQVLGPSKSTASNIADRLFKNAKASDLPESNDQPQAVRVRIALWNNGFTVDDGPLRSFDDPTNLEFLSSIKHRRIPAELLAKFRGATIDIDLERRIHENYVPPKVTVRPFQGRGYTLGSVLPDVTGAGQMGVKVAAGSNSSAVASDPAKSSSSSTAPKPVQPQQSNSPPPPVLVDKSQPTTKINIRSLNGERMVAELNLFHTVADIRQYIVNSDPSGTTSATEFVLMTGFPCKELSDESQTIEQAGLLNATVFQKVRK